MLIRAIMHKLKIGSEEGKDTPIDEIKLYIKHIRFEIGNRSIMNNLTHIQNLNDEYDFLQRIKINMSLQDIIDNPERVIKHMVEH